MKITVPDTAIETLKSILAENTDKPQNIWVYFQGVACSGPSFGLALDEMEEGDVSTEVDGLTFVMAPKEYEVYGDIVIEDTGFGFRVIPESMVGQSCSCDGGCGGCCGE